MPQETLCALNPLNDAFAVLIIIFLQTSCATLLLARLMHDGMQSLFIVLVFALSRLSAFLENLGSLKLL
jgi:hypothetical protein